jgi:hypothetical protein
MLARASFGAMIVGRPFVLLLLASAIACGAAPTTTPVDPGEGEQVTRSAPRRADLVDDCAPIPGQAPPQPLAKQYTGVAAKARCQREVYTIMGGLTHFLGVRCAYCHEEPDYAKMTHRKHVANWMARELIPSLSKRNGSGEIWCNDCHLVDGKGTAKILGNPRDRRWAIEWMTTHLVDDFDAAGGNPLRCKHCHQGNLGSREFQPKIILTQRLPAEPNRPAEPEPSAPEVVSDPTEAPDSATETRD